MKNLSPATSNYLLEVSLEDLHQESRTWLSEIEFWKIELSFYQKLLEKVAVKLTNVEEKKKTDHFQNLIIYFQGELLDQYEHDIREHEKYLNNMVQEKIPLNEQLYREVHKNFEHQIKSFGFDLKQFKKDLFAFAEKYI
jgi:hypothetical protein